MSYKMSVQYEVLFYLFIQITIVIFPGSEKGAEMSVPRGSELSDHGPSCLGPRCLGSEMSVQFDDFHPKMWRSLLLSLYIQCISVFGSDDDDEKTYSFKVNPGGQLLHHEETRKDISCKFSYQAQGGTNEDWLMKISLNAKGEYSCTVERPGSYLFFQSFELKVTGAKSVEGYAFGQISNPLNPDEYSLDFDSKNVGTIKQVDGKFKSQLQMVYIKALQGTKEEL